MGDHYEVHRELPFVVCEMVDQRSPKGADDSGQGGELSRPGA
jgi:hypothetical protein